eukprot:TRINITY_DN25493_c0_g1_i1.p1 TRINITY_DN25493_c0_g1~~TRINITY_DN25493_c0_g1_i1.p1  ORF type:complete len:475 (+),score=72.03 TRINITY_DN25493_c0_g1_i1:80-1504(+)
MPSNARKVSLHETSVTSSSMDIEDAIDAVGMGFGQWVYFVICGLFLAADAVEVSFLSFVTEVLKRSWDLSPAKESTIIAVVFVGQFVGAPVWGFLADKCGRKISFLVSAGIVTVFGFLTACCYDYQSLVAVRAIVGFGISGISVPYDIFAESLPRDRRGALLMSTMYWWSVGSLYSTFTAWLTLESYGWKVYTVAAALPTALATVLAIFLLPESAHWLASEGRAREAAAVLNKLAKQNGRDLRFKEITVAEVLEDLDTSSLFQRGKLRRPFYAMCLIWFGFGVAYYGLFMLIPRMFQDEATGESSESGEVHFAFTDIAISNTAQALGLLIGILFIDSAGRKGVQVGGYLVCAFSAVFLGFKSLGFNTLTFMASVSVCGANAASSATWVHTPELFPTKVRGVAHSLLNAVARAGAFLAPYAVSDMFSDLLSALCVTVFALLAAFAVMCTPETAGRSLDDEDVETSGEENDSGDDL